MGHWHEMFVTKSRKTIGFLRKPHNLEVIRRTMDIHFFNYNSFIFFGDFNADISDKAMLDFSESYNLKSLIKQPTWFNPLNASVVLI